MNIRYPNIGSGSAAQQIEQIRGFLYQLVEQLNTEGLGSGQGGGQVSQIPDSLLGQATDDGGVSPGSTFNQIKSLIIKSADIVEAYYEQINKKLKSSYVAESVFGSYKKETEASITENAEGIKRLYESEQRLKTVEEYVLSSKANIRQGLLFTVGEETMEKELGQDLPEGAEVFGVEVGQTVEENGVKVFEKFARFTSYGMTLYDNNGNLSAYITDERLNIPNAVIENTLTRGGFAETINADGSSVERWVGV